MKIATQTRQKSQILSNIETLFHDAAAIPAMTVDVQSTLDPQSTLDSQSTFDRISMLMQEASTCSGKISLSEDDITIAALADLVNKAASSQHKPAPADSFAQVKFGMDKLARIKPPHQDSGVN